MFSRYETLGEGYKMRYTALFRGEGRGVQTPKQLKIASHNYCVWPLENNQVGRVPEVVKQT